MTQRDEAARRRVALARSRAHEEDDIRSQGGRGEVFGSIMERRVSRRGLLKSGVAAAAVVLAGPALSLGQKTEAQTTVSPGIRFTPLAPQPATNQQVMVPEGYEVAPLLRWGDPITRDAPEWDLENLSAEAQSMQFGYNCDYIGWVPLPDGTGVSARGLLWTNHEYTNEELMFAGYDPANPTREQVDIALQAHGGSIVELRRDAGGRMRLEIGSPYNRRITATTPMRVSGPAASHDLLRTADDPNGLLVLGMLNNCAGGVTPWGTILTCEENFHQYFSHNQELPDNDVRKTLHERYGLPEGASERRWERYYGRFSIADAPNEPFRHGWVVEIDPADPDSTPVKRTAMGRFRHEGATFGHSPSGRVVFYSGDDERFEYVYKYVSDEAWDPIKRGMGQGLLDNGTLYVAVFNDDGTGEWRPLRYGEGPLTDENGFTSQGDVLVKTRLAGDALGATKMDRPEDIQQNPIDKKVYIALTNNTQRTDEETDTANPRPENAYGHIVELTEDGDDAASESFTWDIFLLCGDPSDESTYFAGFPKENVSPISNPDNVNFDMDGNLWISTDGQPRTLELADALHVVPTDGPERGNLQQFLSVTAGAECASFDFVNDYGNLFVSVQHPGEGGTVDEPVSQWPDGQGAPRPTVIQVWARDGGRIGQS